jgi:DNA end-binding protein Ku
VTQFVEADELLPEYIEKPYFVVPEKDSVEAYPFHTRLVNLTAALTSWKISHRHRKSFQADRIG